MREIGVRQHPRHRPGHIHLPRLLQKRRVHQGGSGRHGRRNLPASDAGAVHDNRRDDGHCWRPRQDGDDGRYDNNRELEFIVSRS